jgi:hypothetical protein
MTPILDPPLTSEASRRYRWGARGWPLIGLVAALIFLACGGGAPDGRGGAPAPDADPPATAQRPLSPPAPPLIEPHDHYEGHDHFPGVARISVAELEQQMSRGEVVIIDVRDFHSFVAGHIPGSLQIPEGFIAGEVPHLPRGRPIVTYCA